MALSRKAKIVISVAAIFGAAALLANPYMTDPEGAKDTLESHGFSNIQTGGYSWMDCGRGGSLWKTEFTATTREGKEVEGLVCKGLAGSRFVLY
jgi:hypothetical protein